MQVTNLAYCIIDLYSRVDFLKKNLTKKKNYPKYIFQKTGLRPELSCTYFSLKSLVLCL